MQGNFDGARDGPEVKQLATQRKKQVSYEIAITWKQTPLLFGGSISGLQSEAKKSKRR